MTFDYQDAYNRSGDNIKEYFTQLIGQNGGNDLDSKQITTAWSEYNKYRGNRRRSSESTGTVSGTIATGIDDILGNQKESFGGNTYAGEFVGLQDAFRSLMNSKTDFINFGDIVSNIIEKSKEQILLIYRQQTDLFAKINEQTGLSGQLSKDFREEITKTTVYANRLGISFDQVSSAIAQILENSGRFRVMNEETMNKVMLMSKIAFSTVEDAAKSIESFQNISLGTMDAMEAVDKMALSSFQLGLNAKKTTEGVMANLAKLNQFGFKDGVDGLNRMVQRSIEFKTNLSDIFNLADKVMDPTNAIELSANLQVIGGALGDFNDPLKMMYMATNNVEGLQDALIGSVEQMVQFNEESGRFEITGANLRRAKAMAEALGMSYTDLATTAVNAAQRTSAYTDILSSGFIMDEGLKEFVANMAQMKNGQMVVEITSKELQEKLGGKTEIALSQMTEQQAVLLKGYQDEFIKMDSTDIAIKQVNVMQNLDRNVSFIAAATRLEAGKGLTKILELTGLDIEKLNKAMRGTADDIVMFEKDINNQILGALESTIRGTIQPKQEETTKIPTEASNTSIQPVTKSEDNTLSTTTEKINKVVMDVNIQAPALFDQFQKWLINNWDELISKITGYRYEGKI